MSGPTLRDFADAVERIAFSIPAPNDYTPQLAMLAGSMRQQYIRSEASGPDLYEALKRAEAFFAAMHIVLEPEDIHPHISMKVVIELRDAARSALAKAKGGT